MEPITGIYFDRDLGVEKQLFLDNNGTRIYAVMHIPDHYANPSCGRVGVIYCHPFLYEHYHSHPLSVSLSRALCQSGITVLRLDLRGYGNSEGDFGKVTLSDWISDIRVAVEFLRTTLDIPNIGLIGFRLGANIALWTASDEDRIGWLILCEPIPDMHRYFRELLRRQFVVHAFQQAGREASVKSLFDRLNKEGMLDIAGYRVTKPLYEELKERYGRMPPVNTTTMILHRRDGKPSEGISTLRKTLGLDEAICEVRSVHYKVPWQRLERMEGTEENKLIHSIVDWVANFRSEDRHFKACMDLPPSVSNRLSGKNLAECVQDASQREIPVSFTSREAKLFGILHIPDGQTCSRDIGIVVLPGKPDTASGPHQMYTKAARRLCDAGFYCLRFDYRGTGDSEGDAAKVGYRSMWEDLCCALSFLRETTRIQKILLMGLCAGAKLALAAMQRDQDIIRVVFCAPEPFNVATEGVDSNDLKWFSSALLIYAAEDPDIKVSSHCYTSFLAEHNIPYEEVFIEGADHTFRSVASENAVIDATVNWLTEES